MADLYETIQSTAFRNKCNHYLKISAVAVTTEDPGTVNHAERLKAAGMIIWEEISTITMAYLFATNPSLVTNITSDTPYDGDMQFIADSLINPLALSLAALA